MNKVQRNLTVTASFGFTEAAKLKEYGKSSELTLPMMRLMLAEEKPKKRKVTIRGDEKISQYLSEDYSDDDIGSAFGGMERFKRREETVKGAVRWVSY